MRGMFKALASGVLAVAALISSAGSVHAGPPTFEAAAGYSCLFDDVSMPLGATLSFAAGNKLGAFVLEAAANDGTKQYRYAGTAQYQSLSVLAGPRLTPWHGRVRPYVEALVGIEEARSRSLYQARGEWGHWFSETRLSIQAGLGANVSLTPRWAFRLSGGLRLHRGRSPSNAMPGSPESRTVEGAFRLGAAVVHSWGAASR
jgi:hypothetical protein